MVPTKQPYILKPQRIKNTRREVSLKASHARKALKTPVTHRVELNRNPVTFDSGSKSEPSWGIRDQK